MLTQVSNESEQISIEGIISIVEHLSELLPSQGPIDVFIHHNTLHGLETLKFFEAIEEGSKIFEAKAYLDESQYLKFYQHNRITKSDLDYVLKAQGGDSEEIDLLVQILINTPEASTFQQIKWLLREENFQLSANSQTDSVASTWIKSELFKRQSKLLEKISYSVASGLQELVIASLNNNSSPDILKEALWSRCLLGIVACNQPISVPENHEDSYIDDKINPFLIRFCEEYLDLGQANIAMPNREEGLLKSFYQLIEHSGLYLPEWLSPISQKLSDFQSLKPEELILRLLQEKDLTFLEAKELIFDQLLALKGWAGFISSAEKNPSYLHHLVGVVKPSLMEYLALRLILVDLVSKFYRQEIEMQKSEQERRPLISLDHFFIPAFHLFNLVSTFTDLSVVFTDQKYFEYLIEKLLSYPKLKRQRIWHLAYEENLYRRALSTLYANRKHTLAASRVETQMVFCLDDREESLRRHIEALSSEIETFGTVGFFGIDAIYQSISGEHAPYCPILVKPTHIVRQKAKEHNTQQLLTLQKRKSANLYFNNYLSRFSGSIIHGWLMTIIGIFSLFPMILSILFPRLRRPLNKFFDSDESLTTALSDIEIEVSTEDPLSSEISGYTEQEMAERVSMVLQTIGLTSNFGKLLIFYGHGSSSRNNPLKSAYDCGACGGRPGRINARVIAMMINRRSVRELLHKEYSITIPQETYCIGAYHNTCNDRIQYYDLDLLPSSHRPLFEKINALMSEASQSNSLERCRRFAQVSVHSRRAAFREVNSRSQTLAEPRPEYGHAGNVLCFAGKRSETKNLFFDRRAFLASYDYQQDPDSMILSSILSALAPVCGGINLEYFFSALDNEVYGAGSKLPHNIVSMLGLMNGTCSDLRTGLPQQMIEIHEPVRLLMVVSCQLAQLQKAITATPTVSRMMLGQWIRLVCWDKEEDIFMELGSDGNFIPKEVPEIELPIVDNYLEGIIHRSENLDFYRIG